MTEDASSQTLGARSKNHAFSWGLFLFAMLICQMVNSPEVFSADVVVQASAQRGNMQLEGLGVETGIYDNDLTDPGVADRIRESGIRILRYPGGSYSDIYHWQSQTTTGGTNWVATNSDFLSFMSKVVKPAGSTAMITVNYGSNPSGTGGADPDGEAVKWVEFANLTKRYGIKYWEIGNEVFGNGFYGPHWEMDLHPSHLPMTYGDNVALFSRNMKAVDPTIRIGAVLTTPGFWPDAKPFNWNRGVLQRCGDSIDFVVVHFYPDGGNADHGGAKILAKTADIPAMVSHVRSLLKIYCGTNAPNVQIAVTEAGGGNFGADAYPAESLFVADVYLTWIENGVFNVDWHELHNTFLTTENAPGRPYFGALMARLLASVGDTFIGATSSQPQLRVHACAKSNSISVILINENSTNSQSANVTIEDVPLADSGIEYSFGQANYPAGSSLPASGPATNSLAGLGNRFNVNVPPYSMIVLSIPAETNVSGAFKLVPVSSLAENSSRKEIRVSPKPDPFNKQWTIQSLGNGICRISPGEDASRSLGFEKDRSNSTSDLVAIKNWNGGIQQKWKLTYNGDGSYRLTPLALATEALTASHPDDASPFRIASWNGSAAQRWYLKHSDH